MRKRLHGAVGLLAVGGLLGTFVPPAGAEETGRNRLAERLREAMNEVRFQEVLDTAPPGSATARTFAGTVDKEARGLQRPAMVADPRPIVQQPQVDATVIELDSRGRPRSSGTVLMSPLYKDGVIVPVDRDYSTESVRWRQWDDAGWYANRGQGTIDVIPGRENAPIDHMLAYPASVLKLMVAFGVLRLVDQGVVGLDDTYEYRPAEPSLLCGEATAKPVRRYLDESLTWSSNAASCALIKLLHDHGGIDPLNRAFSDLGLRTLRLRGTRPSNGGRWSNEITMSSLDTAKLLLLVGGGPGTLWTAPDGTPVTRNVLSPASRRFFADTLAQQGFNDMLSNTNRCGAAYPAQGIPQRTPSRWIGADGTVTVNGLWFGHDVRPCDAAAEVTFAHKTGWVGNSGADAGIVRALPGRGGRHYIIVVFSNLGTQYIDPHRPPTPPGVHPVTYTEKFADLARIIDTYEKSRHR
ncbi:serine hydrolase [Thermomonospora amylolytica]|uniref:serine hydrolase n=1 Tax=Thermomonospora amylolytica TaxID=1411117 RepID=UPI0018E57B61|nr:serine hydrolase [Thermomonospora amylolytica]